MKKYVFLAVLAFMVASSELLADASNSEIMKVTSIEVRGSGYHAIYFSGSLPTQECTNEDRAIVVESGGIGAEALLQVAMKALLEQKNVLIRVDGCAIFNPAKGDKTAPKIIKLRIFN